MTALKGLLCLSIFLHHATGACQLRDGIWGFFGRYGGTACSFFFVISGFLLFLRYRPVESAADWLKLMRRRVMGILPIHYATLAFCVACYLLFNYPMAGYSTGFWQTIPSFFLVHDWIPFHPEIRQCWNGVSWYISALFFCWLVYPYLFNRFEKARPIFLGAAIAWMALLLINLRTPFLNEHEFAFHFPLSRLIEFFMGAIAASVLKTRHIPYVIGLAGATILGLVRGSIDPHQSTIGFCLAPAFALLLIPITTCPMGKIVKMLCAPFKGLGMISMEFFMLHAIMIPIGGAIIHRAFQLFDNPHAELLAAFVASTLAATAVHYGILLQTTRRNTRTDT